MAAGGRTLFLLILALAIACDGTTANTTTTPPAPPPPPAAAPTPLSLSVNPPVRKATAQPGTPAPSDNATITLTGDNAAAATWTATARQPWATLVASTGTGSGSLTWLRSTAGLAVGTYVDTIAISVPGASDSPVLLIDSLQISANPVPLALGISPASRSVSAIQNGAANGDNVGITLSGDGASTASWSVSSRASWDILGVATGAGSGTATWTRNTAGLAPGTYVDTLTVTAPGANGSPATLIDTLTITPPLLLAVSPTGSITTVSQGSSAPAGSSAVTLSGTGAVSASWSASGRASWATLTMGAGSGSGTLAWTRNAPSLPAGTYVDTITVTAPSAIGSPVNVIDTLVILAAPVHLALAVSPHSFSTAVTQGASAAAGSAVITLSGDNATTATWSASKKKSWTTLTTGGGTGSGSVTWSRATASLAAGMFVDTITVTATGATGSPTTIIDSIIVSAASGGGGGGGGGTGGATADLGVNADLHGKQVFPVSNPWNQPVDTAQVDPNSSLILSTIGLTVSLHPDWGSTWGIPYVVVPDATPRVTVPFQYADESDPGPYPIPANPPIEDGGDPGSDSHLLVITQNEWKLYELYYLQPNGAGWTAGSGAIFDLTNGTNRPAGWTSADAAGLPILPGLVRYDEVYLRGEIDHALRFTVQHSRSAYVPPATHSASSLTGAQYAPMGMRVRLKASFDISGYPAPMQVILKALKKYGMMVADNGSNFFVSGTADARWNDDVNNLLKQVKVGDFEVVKMSGVVTQ